MENNEESTSKKVNRRLNNMSSKEKIISIVCLLAIFGTLFYISTLDTFETITYYNRGVMVCEEQYINGIINGSYCKENTLIYPEEKVWELPVDYTLDNKTLVDVVDTFNDSLVDDVYEEPIVWVDDIIYVDDNPVFETEEEYVDWNASLS